jgi:photosystem II stability/assembly factor-like uncharacterized protein
MRRLVVAVLLVCATAIAPAQAATDVWFGGMSFSDAQHGWAIFATECGSRAVCGRVESTADGGRVWHGLARLHVCDGVQAILCDVTAYRVTANVGFVSDGQTMLTRDGGRTWLRTDLPYVEAFAAVPGAVFALTSASSGCPLACDVVLHRASIGAHRFTAVRSFRSPSQGFGDTLAGAGPNLYAIGFGHPSGGGGSAYSQLSISRDGGRTWSLRDDPCRLPGGRELDTQQLAAAGRYAAVLCLARGTSTTSLLLSRDAGRTFMRVPSPVAHGRQIEVTANGTIAIIDLVDGGDALTRYRLALSRDLGRTWRIVVRSEERLGPAGPPSVRIFGRSLRALMGRTLWRSDDAGKTWKQSTRAW